MVHTHYLLVTVPVEWWVMSPYTAVAVPEVNSAAVKSIQFRSLEAMSLNFPHIAPVVSLKCLEAAALKLVFKQAEQQFLFYY